VPGLPLLLLVLLLLLASATAAVTACTLRVTEAVLAAVERKTYCWLPQTMRRACRSLQTPCR
jgi:hypothetical protein